GRECAGQQHEGQQVSEHHQRVPSASAIGGQAQGEGADHLGEDRPAQQERAHPASSARAVRDPSSTTATPAATSTIPAILRAVNASPKNTAESSAVSTTPQAPQSP